jgi:hypothetical protein
MQVLDPAIEVCLIILPCQTIHARGGFPLESEECRPKYREAEMVKERGELLLPSLPCRLPYAVQRL